jgi:hypothetical protein
VQEPNSGLDRLFVEISRSHTSIHTHTPDRSSLNEWSARRGDRYLHNTQQTTNTRHEYPCPPSGFEPTIPAIKRCQTYGLDRRATGIDYVTFTCGLFNNVFRSLDYASVEANVRMASVSCIGNDAQGACHGLAYSWRDWIKSRKRLLRIGTVRPKFGAVTIRIRSGAAKHSIVRRIALYWIAR